MGACLISMLCVAALLFAPCSGAVAGGGVPVLTTPLAEEAAGLLEKATFGRLGPTLRRTSERAGKRGEPASGEEQRASERGSGASERGSGAKEPPDHRRLLHRL